MPYHSPRNITYAIDTDNGLVISRVDSEVAIPVLQYEKMVPENNFETSYKLEKFNVYDLRPWDGYFWTKKIPRALKNKHREFWGMKPLTGPLSKWEAKYANRDSDSEGS